MGKAHQGNWHEAVVEDGILRQWRVGRKRIRTKVVKPEEAASHFSRKDGNSGQIDLVERKGISRAIEVVVRPANLGLGFGNFVEQSQLKVTGK